MEISLLSDQDTNLIKMSIFDMGDNICLDLLTKNGSLGLENNPPAIISKSDLVQFYYEKRGNNGISRKTTGIGDNSNKIG